ncbi:MAG: M20/M25/M40 family metallo-hydrolase [Myxococcota bacterium]
MKRALGLLAIVLLALLAVGAWRAWQLPSRQLEAAPLEDPAIDADRVAGILGRTLVHRTISHYDRERVETAAFEALQSELDQSFPRVHATLAVERFSDWSLLYHWPGSDPSLEPILLAAHQDVVPVDPSTADQWEQPPFSGAIVAGEIWGRGALDDKGSLVCVLEAVEGLLAEGFSPARGVYLAFGHDEEVGGHRGAEVMAKALEARGVRLEWVLDEGGVVVRDLVDGFDDPIALIGVAEKGSVSLALINEGPGGHSSIPPAQTAVGIVAAGVQALEQQKPEADLVQTTRSTIAFLAPELPFAFRFVLANLGVFEGWLLRGASHLPPLDAANRTTTAATIFHGGTKENVLPRRAEAVVNFRIRPGDSVASITEHVRATVADPRIRVEVAGGTTPREPSPESSVDSDAFAILQQSIHAQFSDALVLPYLVVGGTDARHYARVSDDVYRFLPFRIADSERSRLHGINERVAIDDLVAGVRFYRDAILRSQPGAGTITP